MVIYYLGFQRFGNNCEEQVFLLEANRMSLYSGGVLIHRPVGRRETMAEPAKKPTVRTKPIRIPNGKKHWALQVERIGTLVVDIATAVPKDCERVTVFRGHKSPRYGIQLSIKPAHVTAMLECGKSHDWVVLFYDCPRVKLDELARYPR